MSEEVKSSEEKGTRRRIVGRVVSSKMEKTVSVAIDRRLQHPVVGKYIRRTTKVLAHDANNDCNVGDRVAISECKPVSRHKAWEVVDIVERATAVE